jgi:hypothetical protein
MDRVWIHIPLWPTTAQTLTKKSLNNSFHTQFNEELHTRLPDFGDHTGKKSRTWKVYIAGVY